MKEVIFLELAGYDFILMFLFKNIKKFSIISGKLRG